MHLSWLLTFLQIILESLPISSSTHIAFLSAKFGLPFEVALDHAVHGVTLLIILLFWRCKIFEIIIGSWQKKFYIGSYMLVASILPTALFFSPIKHLLSSSPTHFGLLITALLLFVSNFYSIKKRNISLSQALILGIAQSLALIPGISRMGITYSFARFMHHSPETSLWLSCLIEIPICGGGILLALKKIDRIILLIDDPLAIIIGLIISTIISYGALYATYVVCTKNKAWIFSLYLLVIAFLAL